LRYWHWIVSADECGFDVATVLVDGDLARLDYLCKSRNTGHWVEIAINLSNYAGRTLMLQVRVQADAQLESNLYLDDFSFEASASGDG